MDPTTLLVGAVVRATLDGWRKRADQATEDQREYQGKLETADADHVFRFIFLINNAAVEQYVSQSRTQATASFLLSRVAAILGFGLFVAAIVIGLVSQGADQPLSIAYLSAIGGAISQFLAGVFFWLYNRTLQQINLFYQGIMSQQSEALTVLGRASEAAREAERSLALAGLSKSKAPSSDADTNHAPSDALLKSQASDKDSNNGSSL